MVLPHDEVPRQRGTDPVGGTANAFLPGTDDPGFASTKVVGVDLTFVATWTEQPLVEPDDDVVVDV